MDLEKFIIDILKKSKKPVKVGDIQRLTGYDRNSIQKTINKLSLEGRIEVDRCYNKIIGLKGEENG
ncbi:MarR family transcriptional regulator [Persephonella hydrogeniphila]|nr:MarR family transcriptional regulator [Persephonella hydrogeniphila]